MSHFYNSLHFIVVKIAKCKNTFFFSFCSWMKKIFKKIAFKFFFAIFAT